MSLRSSFAQKPNGTPHAIAFLVVVQCVATPKIQREGRKLELSSWSSFHGPHLAARPAAAPSS